MTYFHLGEEAFDAAELRSRDRRFGIFDEQDAWPGGGAETYNNNPTAERKGNWQQVYTGRQFWTLDPRPEDIDIHDIAHALALQCRYGGHCESFYSVAEHSVLVSYVVPPELALIGLLHDATEAYCVDVPRPLKVALSEYKDIEDRIWRAIATRFGLPLKMPQAIKDADNAVLLAEQQQIMKSAPAPWCIPGKPADVGIACLSPAHAEDWFLRRFKGLTAA